MSDNDEGKGVKIESSKPQADENSEQARRDKERELFGRLTRVKAYPVVLEPEHRDQESRDKKTLQTTQPFPANREERQ